MAPDIKTETSNLLPIIDRYSTLTNNVYKIAQNGRIFSDDICFTLSYNIELGVFLAYKALLLQSFYEN